MAKISDDAARRIDDHVTKYMDVLQIDGERPVIKVRDNSKAWAGRADRHPERPTTLIELQKKWLSQGAKHDKFAERVVAHEMVHHRNYLAGTEDEKHGPAFAKVPRVSTRSWDLASSQRRLVPRLRNGWLRSVSVASRSWEPCSYSSRPSDRVVNERGHYGESALAPHGSKLSLRPGAQPANRFSEAP